MTYWKRILTFLAIPLLTFVLCKVAFILFHESGRALSISQQLLVIWHGLPMDLAVVAALGILFFVLKPILSIFMNKDLVEGKIAFTWISFVSIAAVFICSIDSRLFNYWGFKLDRESLKFLSTPVEAFASVAWLDILVFALYFVLVLIPLILLLRRISRKGLFLGSSPRHSWWSTLLLVPALFAIGRGGVGPSTMNQSRVYHSPSPFANMAAINPLWNLAASMLVDPLDLKRYTFEDVVASDIYISEKDSSSGSVDDFIDRSRCKNVILVILESFTANAIQSITPTAPNVTPHLNEMSEHGVLFTNFYSTGDRSGESLVSLLCGFPAFTVTDVLDEPKRVNKLPNLYSAFNNKGYHTAFLCGGDLRFSNLQAPLIAGGVDQLVSITDFSRDLPRGSWGVHDEATFERFSDIVRSSDEPFFATIFSLSSHEPFIVPKSYPEMEAQTRQANAMYYTDEQLGKLIGDLEKSDLLDSTLVLISSDHGVREPGSFQVMDAGKFHIPLLLFGGPVTQPVKIHTPTSQVGVFNLVQDLYDLKGESMFKDYDLFDSHEAFYAYREGGGLVDDGGWYYFDMPSGRSKGDGQQITRIKSYLSKVALGMEEISGP